MASGVNGPLPIGVSARASEVTLLNKHLDAKSSARGELHAALSVTRGISFRASPISFALSHNCE